MQMKMLSLIYNGPMSHQTVVLRKLIANVDLDSTTGNSRLNREEAKS